MDWSEVKEHIGSVAPLIGSVIAGPGGSAIGALIASKLGVENTPDSIINAIHTDPDATIKLKQLEIESTANLRDYSFKVLDAELKDTQNARLNNKFSRMPAIICCALTVMVFIGGYAIFMTALPKENETLGNLLFGALLAKWGDSIAYWVGTTRSSAEKTKLGTISSSSR